MYIYMSRGLGGLIVGGRGLFVKFIRIGMGRGFRVFKAREDLGFGVLKNSARLGPCCRT